MKPVPRFLPVILLLAAWRTAAFAGGTITDGTASLQFVGNPIFSAPNGDANLTFPGILDQQSRYTWYYRTPTGTNSIFSALDTPTESYVGNTATITYTNAGPGVSGFARFNATFTITLTSSASGKCLVNTRLVFTAAATNMTTQTFNLFHVIGFDLGANGQNDTYHVLDPNAVSGSITDTGSSNFVQFRGDGANRYEFNLGSTLNSEAGSGLSNFATAAGTTASDFSSSIGGVGVQFTRTLAPGQSTTITTSYALNMPLPVIPSAVVSRKNHTGVGNLDIPLPLTGTSSIECRSGGGTGDYQLVFTFPNAVTFTGAAVTSGTGSVSSTSGNGTTTPTVNLTGINDAQRITATLQGVNNGTSTGDVAVPIGILIGDTNSDGTVNTGDTIQTRGRSGQTTDATNFRSDVNLDGTINSGDQIAVRARSGNSLP